MWLVQFNIYEGRTSFFLLLILHDEWDQTTNDDLILTILRTLNLFTFLFFNVHGLPKALILKDSVKECEGRDSI